MELSHNQVQLVLKLRELRTHRERTHIGTWKRRGFLPEERYWLSEISKAGSIAPYIRIMVYQRTQHLLNNKIRWKWSERRYREEVAESYEDMGVRARRRRESIRHYILSTFYDYLALFKKQEPEGVEYESPKKRRRARLPKGKRVAQTTKRRQLRQKIDAWNDKIRVASARGDREAMRRLERERNQYQNQLDKLK